MSRRRRAGALPTTNIHSIQILRHLADHHGVKTSISSRNGLLRPTLLQDSPKLLRLVIGRIRNLQVSTLGDDVFRSERTLGEAPARLRPPFLDGGDFCAVLSFFGGHVVDRYDVVLVDRGRWDGGGETTEGDEEVGGRLWG